MTSRSGAIGDAGTLFAAVAAALAFLASVTLGDVPFGAAPASRPFGLVVIGTLLATAWLGYRGGNVLVVLFVGAAPFLGVGSKAILSVTGLEELPGVVGATVGGGVLVGVGGYAVGVASAWAYTDREVSAYDVGRLGVLVLGAAAVVAVAGFAYVTTYPGAFPA